MSEQTRIRFLKALFALTLLDIAIIIVVGVQWNTTHVLSMPLYFAIVIVTCAILAIAIWYVWRDYGKHKNQIEH